MADVISKILAKPHVDRTLRFMVNHSPLVVMPQFERLWGDYWLSEPDRDSSISYATIESHSRGDVKLLERAGLLKSVSFKMPWPVPDPTDPRIRKQVQHDTGLAELEPGFPRQCRLEEVERERRDHHSHREARQEHPPHETNRVTDRELAERQSHRQPVTNEP